MCYAPTLTRDIDLPMLDETFELSDRQCSYRDPRRRRRRDSSPAAGVHRRSYILATRQESSKGERLIDEDDVFAKPYVLDGLTSCNQPAHLTHIRRKAAKSKKKKS